MPDLADLQREFFDWLYTYRIPIVAASAVAFAAFGLIAARRGWLAAARRHRGRSAVLLAVVLAVGIPAGWYLASPIFIRTELIEPDPIAARWPHDADAVASAPGGRPTASPTTSPARLAPAAASPRLPRPRLLGPWPRPARRRLRSRPPRASSGTFTGTDDFHFGRGTATIVETAPGSYVLRLEDFSVRNGPDLYVYLSPDKSDYVDGALELGKLKATDGAFGYALPAGTDPADFASALIWCKQFSPPVRCRPVRADLTGPGAGARRLLVLGLVKPVWVAYHPARQTPRKGPWSRT